MDPVSAVASVVALVGVTLKTVKYVNDMTDVSKERQSLSQESADLLQMLTGLRNMIEDPKRSTTSLDGITRLLAAKGPLDQLREALEQLNNKVKAKRGVQKYARMLVWPHVKKDCKDILDRMERVKSLISLALNGENYELLHAIQTDTAAGMDTIKKGVAGLQVRVDVEERRRTLDWLSPLNFFKTQQDIFARREGDTGQWIIDSPDFHDWFAGPNRTLRCVGIPGAGKSVLASIIVDFLRNTATSDRRRAVAAVFCNFKETTVQSPENLLGSLCIQALHKDVPIPTVLQELYKSHEAKQTRPTLEDINRVFVEIGELFDDLYLVVDALDECSADARSFLTQKLKSLSSNSRLLVTTRPIDDITQRFTSGRVVEIRASDGDLEKYIKAKLQSSSRLSTLLQGQHTLEKEISDRIISKANGMFLAATLHMKSLSSKTNIKALKKAIANLPNELNQLYDEAFERIDGQNEDDQKLAHRALRWVAYAYSPLTVQELEEALAIDPEADDLDREASPPISLVLDACAGLLITDEESATVRLVHYTTQNYFNLLPTTKLQDAHTALGRECIAYLSVESIQSYSIDGYEAHLDYPLLAYASYYWAQHAKTGREAGLAAEIDAYLLKDPRVWLPDSWSGAPQYGEWNKCKGYAIAAYFGLCNPLKRVLAQTEDINVLAYEGRSALHLAAANDQTAAIKILLEHGSDIECMDDTKATPLFVAAKTSSKAAFELLVNEGANVLAMDEDGNVPFTSVNWDSPIPMLQQLLDRGADIDDVSPDYGTCLMRQVERGDAQTVHWLLEKGAAVNIQNHYLETALHKASHHGPVDVVDLLLSHGADARISDKYGCSALHVACMKNQGDVISRLLDHGVDVNKEDNVRWTALNAAACHRDPQCLILLLTHGADVEKQDRYGGSPLHIAAGRDSPHGISALLKAGADISKQNTNGETALVLSILCKSIRAFNALLEAGADISKQNTDGETALMLAARCDSIEASSALLKAGADIEKQDLGGLTALHHAAGGYGSKAVQLLLDSNAAPAVRSNPTWTVTRPYSWMTADRLDKYLDTSFSFLNEDLSIQTVLFDTRRIRLISLGLLLHLLKVLRSPAVKYRVWKSGMTALDIAVLRGDEECIRTLSNASSVSRTESEAMPLVEYLYNICGASTMKELKEKWEQWTEEELEARRRYFGNVDPSEEDESGEEDDSV